MRTLSNLKSGIKVVALGACVAFVPDTNAAVVFTNPTGVWATANFDLSVGTPFTVTGTGISVTSLGFFDEGGDGLLDQHEIGIYRISDQTLLGSTLIPSGTAAYLQDGSRWVDLVSPIQLTTGENYMLATTFTAFGDTGNVIGGITTDSNLALLGTGFYSTSSTIVSNLEYPGTLEGGFFVYGANMMIAASPVPEPGSTAVNGVIGSALIASMTRRKRRGAA